ncbi:hypothetical protein [Nocardioides sp.]|uniref:hypothetical protein n=1 Tax=Nocardioides sp. TaxID=35761 RepID=UPI00286A8CE7|nr:hypothetical protein [Nocardioides sp.]
MGEASGGVQSSSRVACVAGPDRRRACVAHRVHTSPTVDAIAEAKERAVAEQVTVV